MAKQIENMFEIVRGNIADKEKLDELGVDAIVNAAKPTLMGSDQGVDGAIHGAIDDILGAGKFNKKICEELEPEQGDAIIRCKRGKAVTTGGYGLCKYVIHVVGSKYDGDSGKECTSSCVKTLESCYSAIIEEIKTRPDIEVVGIPIIGSGEYKVPYKIASEIAVASLGNALVKWKNEDEEMFEMVGLKKIIFFVYSSEGEDSNKTRQCEDIIARLLEDIQPILAQNRRVVYHTSWQSLLRYKQDMKRNDFKRGYFSIARRVRLALWWVRVVFIPLLLLKDFVGGKDWEKRRRFVEWLTISKMILPVLFIAIVRLWNFKILWKIIFVVILAYLMIDTITYLLSLILMADIQNPSANLIRSIILLLVNYMEVSFDFTFFYYCYYGKTLAIRQALAFGFFNERIVENVHTYIEYIMLGLNTGIKFFFVTLVFSYFMGHMRPREFRS